MGLSSLEKAIASCTPIFASCTPSEYHNARNTLARIFKRRVVQWVLLSVVDVLRGPWWWVLQSNFLRQRHREWEVSGLCFRIT